ncbi:transposase [Streptomyces sp. NPDC056831]|uniref:transposase n=1 Tax=Streptomyces sp. NPDC056831 TaxID=3345954 RepID=UPI00367744EF
MKLRDDHRTTRGDLTDTQWVRLETLLPMGNKPGRPPIWTRRQLIDGIRWRTRTGTPSGPVQDHLAGQQPGQGSELMTEYGPSLPAASDGRLVVPDQRPGHRIPTEQQVPVPAHKIGGLPRRPHPRGDYPRIAGHHHQHRRAPGLPEVQRDIPVRRDRGAYS